MAWFSFLLGWLTGIVMVVYLINKDPSFIHAIRKAFNDYQVKRALRKSNKDFKKRGVEVVDIESNQEVKQVNNK